MEWKFKYDYNTTVKLKDSDQRGRILDRVFVWDPIRAFSYGGFGKFYTIALCEYSANVLRIEAPQVVREKMLEDVADQGEWSEKLPLAA